MRIFSKTKAALALFAAVLVAGFAFAATVEKTSVVWDEGKTFDVDAVGTIELTGMTAAVGDKLIITYEQAGSAAQGGDARAEAPMRDAKRYALLRLFVVDEQNPVIDEEQVQGEGTLEYTFTSAVAASDMVVISARNLTITKVELKSTEEFDPATAIVNPGFELSTAVTESIATTGDGQGTDYESTGWKLVSTSAWCNAAVFAFGSEAQLNSVSIPALDTNGGTGNALGITVGWGGTVIYQSTETVTLPAGHYYLVAEVYNANPTARQIYSQLGFVPTSGEAIVATTDFFACQRWTADYVEIELDAPTEGRFQVGAKAVSGGSGSNAKIFIDNLVLTDSEGVEAIEDKLYRINTAGDIAAVKEEIAAYKALIDLEAWPYASAEKKAEVEAAITAAEGNLTSLSAVTSARDALIEAYRAYVESNATAEGVEGAQVIADAIVNPAAENSTNGWTTTGNGSIDVKNNEPWTDAEGIAEHNYFDGGNWGANSWDVTFAQDITLASGRYVLSAVVRASTNVALTLFAGEATQQATVVGAAGNVFDRGWNDVFVAFDQTNDGTLNIGVRGVTSNQHEWMSFSNFRLVRIGDITVDEQVAAAREALQNEINAAKAKKDAEGTYDAGKDELAAAIEAAEAKLTSNDADELAAALSSLQAAEEAFDKAQAIAANAEKVEGATAQTPVATDFVENGYFDSDTHAWQSTGGFQNRGTATNQAGDFTGKYWENWNPDPKVNKMYQVIENIPNGLYKLKMAAFVNTLAAPATGSRGALKAEATQTVQYVFANDDKAYLTTTSPTFYEVYTTVTDNKVEIGLEQTEAVANWMGVDNASLTYYGAETTEEEAKTAAYDAAYNELKDARQSVKTKSDLDAAYNAYKASASDENIAAIEAAIEASRVSVNSYKVLDAGVLPDNSLNGWTCTNSNNFEINTWSVEGNNDGTGMVTPFIQNWVWKGNNNDVYLGPGEIYYTLPGLDPGIYSFSALIRAYSEAGNYPTGASLFAGTREIAFATGKNFEYNGMKGIYDNYAMSAEVGEDGIFRFGVKISSEVNFNWMAFKNCKVAYVGAAIDAAAVAALAETMPEGKMNADVKAAMEAAKTTAETTPNLDNYEAFQKAIAAAEASVAAYAKMKAVLDGIPALIANTNFYTAAAKATFDEELQAAQNGYEEGTLTDEEANAFNYGSRRDGMLPKLLLSAYSSTVQDTPYINTWSTEGNTDGSDFLTPFYEYWTGDANSLAANTITAELVGLEAGEYEVTALVRVRLKDNVTDAPAGITMQVNEGDAVNVCEGGTAYGRLYLKEYTAKGTVVEGGALKLVFDVAADNNISWLSFKDVKYVKTGSDIPEDAITIPTTWNFSNWTAQGFTETTTIDGLTVAAAGSKTVVIDANSKTVDGVSYTQRLKLGGTGAEDARNLSFTVPGNCTIEVVLTSSSNSGDARTLNIDANTFGNTIGTMTAKVGEVTKEVYTYMGDPAKLFLYSANSGINIYAIYVKEAEPTGISSVEANRFAGSEVYNLRGQRVDNPTKGLYIIGGKKVVLK